MGWIDKLETRFGRFAIHGLTRYIVAFNALVYIIAFRHEEYLTLLTLIPERVMAGEVWRLVSYVFIPPMASPIWIVFALWFLWFIGDGLEQAWGPFRLNLFYLIGMIGCTIAAFRFGGEPTNVVLNLSLLFAFATIYPDEIIYIFFILPVKMKWLAWVSLAGVALTFLDDNPAVQGAIIASLGNYLIFFGSFWWHRIRHQRGVYERRREFKSKSMPETEALHRCIVCERTEMTDPSLDFRVSKDGNEACIEHLPGRSG